MSEATSEWCLMTDIDHLIPESTWKKLLAAKLDARTAYRFDRRDAVTLDPLTTKPNPKRHPNTWLMSRWLFNKAGGYDERFSGHYGSDGEFAGRVGDTSIRNRGRGVVQLNYPIVRVGRELVPDASTTTYTRKDPTLDAGHVKRITKERGKARPLNLTFPWERVF